MPKDLNIVREENGELRKRCSICSEYKPFESFYKDTRGVAGLRSECIPCRRDREHGYYVTDKEKFRNRNRKYKYGITPEQYESLWKEQNGNCDMCNSQLTKINGHKKNTCHVDHCHKTGKIRALLCLQCNSLLGMARDKISILQSAISYLEKHE